MNSPVTLDEEAVAAIEIAIADVPKRGLARMIVRAEIAEGRTVDDAVARLADIPMLFMPYPAPPDPTTIETPSNTRRRRSRRGGRRNPSTKIND